MEAVSAKPLYHAMGISKSLMTDSKGYIVEPITTDDIENVLEFLRKFFFRDEPLNLSIGLLDDEQPTCIELEKFCVEPIPQDLSLKAVTHSGQIIGVCLNGILDREEEEPEAECNNPKFHKIQDLLERVYEEADIFGRYPDVDKMLDIRVASVDEAYRGQGIAKALFNETRRIASERGFPMVKVDCTSHFTALAVSKLGFQEVLKLKYQDYKGEDGKPVFTPEPPHTCVKTFIYRIENITQQFL